MNKVLVVLDVIFWTVIWSGVLVMALYLKTL
jgi:hypothetical protein